LIFLAIPLAHEQLFVYDTGMIAANDPRARTGSLEPAVDSDGEQPSPGSGSHELLLKELEGLIDRLADADPAARLGPRIKGLLRAIDRLDAVVATDVYRFDQGCEYTLTRHRSTVGWLKTGAGLAGVDAARVARRARQVAAMPVFGPLWLAGIVNTSKVDLAATARHRTKADESFAEHEARFAATAVKERPEALESELAQWRDAIDAARHDPTAGDGQVWDTSALHLSELLDGVGVIDAKLTADGFAIIQRAIANEYERAHRADDPRSPAEQRADALVAICRRALEHTARGHQRPHILIHIDLETYLGLAVGLCETDRGTRIPPHIARRIACDVTLQLLIRDHRGVALDLGHSARRFSDDQRRALLGQYPTCVVAGCTIPASDCEMHHIHWWTHNGPTNLANGAPVCWHHHDQIHHHKLRLRAEPDRSITSLDPHGTILGVTEPRRPIEPIPIPMPGPDPGPPHPPEPPPRAQQSSHQHWRPITPPIRNPHLLHRTPHRPARTPPTPHNDRPATTDPTQPDLNWPDLGIELELINY